MNNKGSLELGKSVIDDELKAYFSQNMLNIIPHFINHLDLKFGEISLEYQLCNHLALKFQKGRVISRHEVNDKHFFIATYIDRNVTIAKFNFAD